MVNTILYTLAALGIFTAVVLIPWRKIIGKFSARTSGAKLATSKIGQELLTIALVVAGGILFWYFGWDRFATLPITKQLMVGAGCLGLFWMLSKKPEFSLAAAVKYVGIFLLIFAGLTSGPGQAGLSAIDEVNAAVKSGRSIGCPDSVTISTHNKPDLSLRTGCTQRVVHQEGMDPRFMALDERFIGSINDYVDIRYVAHNVLMLTPKDGTFPSGESELPVAVMNVTEAETVKKKMPDLTRAFGEFKP